MAKKKIDPNDILAQTAISKKLKVYTDFSPYFSKDTQVEISTIEQVQFYHKKLYGSRVIGELVKDKNIRRGKRKRILKALVKFWDKDFKENIETQKNIMIEKTTNLRRKRVKRIGHLFSTLFSIICVLAIFFSQQKLVDNKYFVDAKFIGKYLSQFYTMLDEPLYYSLLVSLVYLSLVAVLYIICLRTYFNILRKVGTNAERFITDEFKKINTSFSQQQTKIRSHLLKSTRRLYKKNYKIKKIFDPNTVLGKLDGYSKHVEEKVLRFRKKYHWLLFLHFLLKVSVLGLTVYIGYNYYNLYF